MSSRFELMEIHEGDAVALIPKLKPLGAKTGYEVWESPVFYNPVMKLSRDISVIALQIFQREHAASLKACEPLAGSGIRAIRWAKEIDGIDQIILNDANPQAYELARRNVQANRAEGKIKIHNLNANLLLQEYASRADRFDTIDLDPFGSPMPFMSSCIAAAKRHSLLAVTATDTAPLCGVKPEACLRKYAAKPLRTSYAHEIAARILIGAAARTASIFEFGISPLLTHSTDHYIRSYIELKMSVKHTNLSLKNLGYLYHCPKCQKRGLTTNWAPPHDHCPSCEQKIWPAGPLWTGQLQDESFCQRVRDEAQERYPAGNTRLLNLLSNLTAEANAPPLYYDLDEICDRLGTPNPPFKKLFQRLTTKRYSASRTHFKPKALKTDAPLHEIEGIIRELTETLD